MCLSQRIFHINHWITITDDFAMMLWRRCIRRDFEPGNSFLQTTLHGLLNASVDDGVPIFAYYCLQRLRIDVVLSSFVSEASTTNGRTLWMMSVVKTLIIIAIVNIVRRVEVVS